VIVKEGKIDKPRTIHLHNIFEELNIYIKELDSKWLFPSRKGDMPITRIQAYRQLNKAAGMCDIEDGIKPHTLRKTFGYWYYK
jgi:integrase